MTIRKYYAWDYIDYVENVNGEPTYTRQPRVFLSREQRDSWVQEHPLRRRLANVHLKGSREITTRDEIEKLIYWSVREYGNETSLRKRIFETPVEEGGCLCLPEE